MIFRTFLRVDRPFSDPGEARTLDPLIKSQLLYQLSYGVIFLFLWCHQESNRGHKDFQSFALPTELWHQNMFLQEGNVVVFPFLRCKGREFSDTVQIFW